MIAKRPYFIILWYLFRKNIISFFLGAICAGLFILYLWCGAFNEGRGIHFDESDIIVQLGFPKGYLFDILTMSKYNLELLFIPFWIIVGGYIAIGIKVILPTVVKKSYLSGKELWYNCIDYIIIKRIKTKK